MTNDIAFVIILGGLDQDYGQAFARGSLCRGLLRHSFSSSMSCVRDPVAEGPFVVAKTFQGTADLSSKRTAVSARAFAIICTHPEILLPRP